MDRPEDHLPTAEWIRHQGELYQPAEVSQKVQRRYARSVPPLEYMLNRGSLTADQYMAGCNLRHAFHMTRAPYAASSWGDERWIGTTDAQMAKDAGERAAAHREECHCHIHRCRKAVGDEMKWSVMRSMLDEEEGFLLAGAKIGRSYRTAYAYFVSGLSAICSRA